MPIKNMTFYFLIPVLLVSCALNNPKSVYFLGRPDKEIPIQKDLKIVITPRDKSKIEDRNLVHDILGVMDSLGFAVFSKTNNPDLILIVSASETSDKSTEYKPVTNKTTTQGNIRNLKSDKTNKADSSLDSTNSTYNSTTETVSYVPYETIINKKNIFLEMYPVDSTISPYKIWEGKIEVSKEVWLSQQQSILYTYFKKFPQEIDGEFKLKN